MRASLNHQHSSLTPFLLMALLAHLLAIALIKIVKHTPKQTPIMLEVKLMSTAQTMMKDVTPVQVKPMLGQTDIAQTKPEPIAMNKQTVINQPVKRAKVRSTQAKPELITEPPAAQTPAMTENLPTPPTIDKSTDKPRIHTENLFAAARQMAIEDEKNLKRENTKLIALADRAFSPEIAKVFSQRKKTNAGVTLYAGGMVKVVNADGSEYCLQQSPMLNKGAFENEPIPMTCP